MISFAWGATRLDRRISMRRELLLSALVAAMFAFATFSAQAMPAPSLGGIGKDNPMITPVAGHCGRGYHRGPHGHCRRNK